MGLGAIDWGDASLPVLSEAECGEWYEVRGRRVVEHRGQLWVESRRCSFQPVHHLANTRPVSIELRAQLAALLALLRYTGVGSDSSWSSRTTV